MIMIITIIITEIILITTTISSTSPTPPHQYSAVQHKRHPDSVEHCTHDSTKQLIQKHLCFNRCVLECTS